MHKIPQDSLVLSIDDFGAEVGGQLVRRYASGAVTVIDYEEQRNTWSLLPHDTTVVISARPTPLIDEQVNAEAFLRGRSFLRIAFESFTVRVGPLVGPKHGVCWMCIVKRQRQHTPWPSVSVARDKFYRNNSAGVRGWIPSAVAIASTYASGLLQQLAKNDLKGGEFWEMNLLSGKLLSGRAIGVDGCTLCGLGIPAEQRTTCYLADALHRFRNMEA